ncbi:hypothetical protein FPZ49_11310 [Paenibacillus cremeus]|uniref:RNA-dependent RNA polymerase n=2 Tax=Paenibacillus cremeus TaxID=2163881 RepID=A0A559KCZ6_9BACL|nr:hypothetical protein FPZ49_11310 [Paenibacillus cremeus]
MHRDKDIDRKYVGMIPSSLELNKLVSIGLSMYKKKPSEKFLSDDIINVKFKQKVKSADEMVSQIKKKINLLTDNQADYKNKLEEFVQLLKQEKILPKWKEVSNDQLRKLLYENGFVLTSIDDKTDAIIKTRYVVYKRSSAKSRVGECLFIKETLYDEMINWSRMNLPLQDVKVDVPSLLAYQSLVGSSLDDVVKIHPNNILLVDDIESKFLRKCNVVRKGENGLLDSFQEDIVISNSLFDGESLLDSSYFPEDKGMMLLRNHMFKSAAFNCNIQSYLRDNCPEGINFDEWKIKNAYNEVFAKDIHLIITPSSLKALKFSHAVGNDSEMFSYWKNYISDVSIDGASLFGVVKSEKKSKHGLNESGEILQQTSYQMLNSMPVNKNDIHELAEYENTYIEKLKNDDDFFVQHILKSVTTVNSNAMFADLYYRNKKIAHTKIFKDFRKAEVNKHLTHIKHGKIRLHGDYCTMLGNPMEFLVHSIGRLNICEDESSLKENEIYTTLFEFNKCLVGFRNPHTSPSNVLVVKNTYNAEIEKYFNLTDNIVCVNAINFPLQDILSGSDYDSDTLLLFDNSKMLELAMNCFGKYNVCINKVESSKRQYNLTESDMAIIDNQLSMSQKNIGRVVNLGQFCMSKYWDLLNKGVNKDNLTDLLKKIDIMTVLSGICIDLAKKFYDIDINQEVEQVAKTKELNCRKPLFWKYVSQNKEIKTFEMQCPMDYLYIEFSDVKYAETRESISLNELLVKHKIKDGDRNQEQKIIKYVEEMSNKIIKVYINIADEDERNHILDDIIKYYDFYISKLKVKPETMYAILSKIQKNKSKVSTRLMNVLYRTQKNIFLNAINT